MDFFIGVDFIVVVLDSDEFVVDFVVASAALLAFFVVMAVVV